jgi:hypothetical protein
MAHQGNPATRGVEATPDDPMTRGIREIKDKGATPAIEPSPVHAPTGSILIPIVTAER